MFCLLGCSDRFYHGMYDGLHHQNTHSGEVRFPQPTKPYDQYKAEREETFTDMK